MLLRVDFEISFTFPESTPVVLMTFLLHLQVFGQLMGEIRGEPDQQTLLVAHLQLHLASSGRESMIKPFFLLYQIRRHFILYQETPILVVTTS